MNIVIQRLTAYLILSVLLFVNAVAATDKPIFIGKAVFVLGDAVLMRSGKKIVLKQGMILHEKDLIQTDENAYIRLKMVDQGLIYLRPSSRLYIEKYQYDEQNPKDSVIKLQLKDGVLRSITGKGGKSAKDKYRLNTPVAAIGIRGTDFTVYTNQSFTRITVASGGVIASGCGAGCEALGIGPCEGDFTRELFANQKGKLLQIQKGKSLPELLNAENNIKTPDKIVPPLEKKEVTPSSKEKNNKSDLESVSSANDVKEELLAARNETQIQEALPQADTATLEPAASKVEWGRWKDISEISPPIDLTELLGEDKEVVAINTGGFVVVRNKDTNNMILPSTGKYDFKLQSSEAYIVNTHQQDYKPANIENAKLTVDFVDRSFSTELDVVTNKQTINVESNGSILSDGKIVDNHQNVLTSVIGSLGEDAAENAAYIFSHTIDETTKAVGATSWVK